MSVLGIFQHLGAAVSGDASAAAPRAPIEGRRTEVGEHQVQIKLLDEDDTELLAAPER